MNAAGYAYFGTLAVFFGALAATAQRFLRARRAWRWAAAAVFVSCVLNGGPGGFVFFGLPLAILTWTAVRDPRTAANRSHIERPAPAVRPVSIRRR